MVQQPLTGSSTTANSTSTTASYYNHTPSSSSGYSENRQPALLSVNRTTASSTRGRSRGGGGYGSYRGSRTDNEGNSDGGGMGFGNFGSGGSYSDSNMGNGQTIVCNCGMEAVQRTVQKAGPNKGRQFFTCLKPRDDQCGFFEWADDVPSCYVKSTPASRRGSGGRGRGRGHGRGPGGTSLGSLSASVGTAEGTARKTRAPPTCSVCRQQGHTKRSCPQAKQLS